MNYLHWIIPLSILLLFIFFLIFFHLKKKRIIKKIRSMTVKEKNDLINELIEPAGYIYDPIQDIFATRLNAPQKLFGYTTFYDLSAPFFNMVFDYETIYFDYGNRTWLIEMWKGQYGINSGCELGIYYADSLVSPENYKQTIFHAVNKEDMPDISLKLYRHTKTSLTPPTRLGYLSYHHWWLTIFKLGVYSKPSALFADVSIRLKNYPMLYSFLDSFEATMPPNTDYRVNGLNVYFTFKESHRKYPWYQRAIRKTSLILCHLYCILFQLITKSFNNSGDKILLIYYYLPFTIRLIFKQNKSKRKKCLSL